MESPESKQSLSITEVMDLYGISRSTIYRRIKDGTLKAYKMGPRIIRLDAAEVASAFLGISHD